MTTIQKSNSKRSPKSPDFGNPTTRVVGLLTSKTIRVIAVTLLAGLIGAGYFGYSRIVSQNSTSTTDETTLQTATATVGDLVLYANGTGTIIPATESSFGFNTSGQVSEIHVQVGDRVEAGQVLAQLDDTEAKVELAEAQEALNQLTSPAALATATQSLAEAQSDFDLAKETLEFLVSPEVLYWEEKVAEREQILADAQTAAQTDTSDTARQKVTEAETSLEYAQAQLKYFNTVYEETYVIKNFTQYKTRRGRGGTKKSLIKVWDEVAGKYVDLVYAPTEGEIGMARADYELAKASIGEAQTYLDVLNGAEIPEGATGANLVTYIQTKHTLETAEYNLKATQLIAPISGTVTALDINVGDYASENSVITISNLDQPYSLDAYLDAEDWGQIRVGYEVEVSFDIIPDQFFTGTVTSVYPTLDTESSNSALVHITARLNESIPYELPNSSAASVDVIGGRAENAVLVPVEALHEIGEGKHTLFVMENGKLRLRVVEVGLQDLTKAEITSGVDAGDIVTTGVVETR
ncbi:MAG TPA: HlyD family efflux transporter periplasmic adaptor subunit [Anaerolineales bacterium]|nr:HlyD family efflux transporter periplasmic adaptor subunit [Anaerolineales bacterium]